MSDGSPSNGPVMGWRTPAMVVVGACIIAMVGYGVRTGLGLFLSPMTEEMGWGRETFALAMAIQNLLWGVGAAIAGAFADRFGPAKVIAVGALVYAAGLWGMAEAEVPLALHVFGGLLIGTGVALTSFSLALASMAKVVSERRRSLALGVGMAAGSVGQVVFSPLSHAFIQSYGWHSALLILAVTVLVLVPLAFVLPGMASGAGAGAHEQSLRDALVEARGHRGYVLLNLGFFVCGFHVAFITVHFPAYVTDLGLRPEVGAYAISIVGLANIAGAFLAGVAGQRWSKKSSLSVIYYARAIVIMGLLMAPASELTIYVFSVMMGLLWLSTVPLTTGIVAQIFGVRYMATLSGIVLFTHQVGSFIGVWMGGWVYDLYGSYDIMWWAGIFFGMAAMVVHLPIDEKPLPRLRLRTA